MAINKVDKSFKVLINKEFTTDQREFYQEVGSDTLNIHSREVWMDTIPQDSASAISQGSAEYYDKFILTQDELSANTFFFMSGSGFTPGTSTYDRTYKQSDFISDKYGSSYEVKLYDDDDTQIYKTDAINWIFDYKTGILHIADPGSHSTPYKLSVFKYTGKTLSEASVDGDIYQYDGTNYFWSNTIDGGTF